MWHCIFWQNFTNCRRNLLLPSATTKSEATCAFKTWVNMSQKTMIFTSLLREPKISQVTELQSLPKTGYIKTDGPLFRITLGNSAVVLMFLPFTLTHTLQFFPHFCKPLLSVCKSWGFSCNKKFTYGMNSSDGLPSSECSGECSINHWDWNRHPISSSHSTPCSPRLLNLAHWKHFVTVSL
jgi:hypothetical protein